jgi:antitoxin ParD1/3/4
MSTIHLTLPQPLAEFVQRQIAELHFNSVDEYVGLLVQEDQQKQQQKALETKLLEGLRSGEAEEWTSDSGRKILEEVERRYTKRLGAVV